MLNEAKPALFLAVVLFTLALVKPEDPPPVNVPHYNAAAQLEFPSNYRKWVYLTTGFDMSYTAGSTPSHHMFDNVFVNPEAYESFLKTGTWPEKTMIVLEARGAHDKGSINQRGNYQGDRMGLEVHVKDARFPGHWAFFGYDDALKPATADPADSTCNQCHAAHGAVDNTFVQFYPTLIDIAKAKGTLTEAYRKAEQTTQHTAE